MQSNGLNDQAHDVTGLPAAHRKGIWKPLLAGRSEPSRELTLRVHTSLRLPEESGVLGGPPPRRTLGAKAEREDASRKRGRFLVQSRLPMEGHPASRAQGRGVGDGLGLIWSDLCGRGAVLLSGTGLNPAPSE